MSPGGDGAAGCLARVAGRSKIGRTEGADGCCGCQERGSDRVRWPDGARVIPSISSLCASRRSVLVRAPGGSIVHSAGSVPGLVGGVAVDAPTDGRWPIAAPFDRRPNGARKLADDARRRGRGRPRERRIWVDR